jgi:DNA polymerase IV
VGGTQSGSTEDVTGDAGVVRPRWILHLDLDQFIAAVEIRRRPELSGKPVVVGGDGNPRRRRQVVATASYEARAFGVRSGMPMSAALRKCPDAVFLPADRDAYDAASREVWDVVRGSGLPVEVWGWDEGFIGTDSQAPESVAQELRDSVRVRTTFTSCVGIGDNKLRAKLATGFAKARDGAMPEAALGVYRLTVQNWDEVMGMRPVDALWGVGSKTATKLHELGVGTVRDLADADVELLRRRFGPTTGPWLVALGRGLGDRTVSTAPYQPRGHSREVTLEHDLVERVDLEETLGRLCDDVMADISATGRAVRQVGIKVRFVPFITKTRVHKLNTPTRDETTVRHNVIALLDRLDPADQGRPVRLLGVRVDLDDGQPPEPPARSAG